MAHGLTEIFAAVGGHEDDALVLEVDFLQQLVPELEIRPHRMVQGINDRIARDENLLCRHILCQEVPLGSLRGGKVQGGDAARELAVHFLRERAVDIVGAEACLHMAHGNLVVVGSQRSGKGGGSIAMHQHDVRLLLLQDLVQAHHGLGGNVKEGLSCGHDIQIVVRFDLEEVQHLVKHIPVLGRHRHHGGDFLRVLLKLQHDGCHLDGLRAGAEYSHHLDFLVCHKYHLSPIDKGREQTCLQRDSLYIFAPNALSCNRKRGAPA